MRHFTLPKDGGLKEDLVPHGILHRFEKIEVEIRDQQEDASTEVADLVCRSIEQFRLKGEKRCFRLGLSTGKSPLSLYRILRRRFEEGKLSFRDVEVFSIDEYYPIGKSAPQSRNRRLLEELLDKVDIEKSNVHIPDGTLPGTDINLYCSELESRARNLDLLILGMGREGQLGFNESGSSEQSRTRTVLLSYKQRKIQAKNFNGSMIDTPKMALTLGIDTMKSAAKIIMLAFGEDKASAVKAVSEGERTGSCPASLLQGHPDIRMYTDSNAASLLTRIESPWLIGPCEWTSKFKRKAVVWLCQKLHKPILKLSLEDYLENSLDELIDVCGPYDKVNIDTFNDLQHTITGWPGGKPNADDSTRPVQSSPYPKKVLIFSPHPDDDVISMGGTFIRLVHQGHDVHVAYETSGDLAVHNDVVIQHMDAAALLGLGDEREKVGKIIDARIPGDPENPELLAIKAAIRRSEARGAVRSFGLDCEKNVHFLNLPFYESGGISKLPCTQTDVNIIKDLMRSLKPDQIYMAGDLADPHGTHRVCTEAALEALEQLREEGEEWVKGCYVWMYRGAWMEWELGKVDMAVPLSPEEVVEKRYAIYHHLSQKDIVPFPGDDPREFWQRAEDRTSNTARLYDELGMAEYQAMEVFLRLY